jgi:mRNA interferase RelE/StbE
VNGAPTTWRVEFTTQAARELRKLPRAVQERLRPRIDALALNPRPDGVAKLSGEDDIWRIRVGEYRVLYAVLDAELLVLVVKVGHRREVCRRR